MQYDFTKYSLPKVYKRNNRECYLDPIRERLIYITPEETVRQQIISYLIQELLVPANMIRVEEALRHYGVNSRGRADIIVEKYDKVENVLIPLCIIECKAPNIAITEKEIIQLFSYCDALDCDYGMISNGQDLFCYYYSQKQNEYLMIESLPQYIEQIKGEHSVFDMGEV